MSSIIKTMVISLMGGYLFYRLNMPMAWMLGPLTAVLIYSQVFQQTTNWPFSLREGAQIILGSVMGSSFSPETALAIVSQLPYMLISTVVTIPFALLFSFFIPRLTHISFSSCILGSIPGGLSQMAILSDEIEDADVSVVTFMQTIRLLTVVFVVPFLVLKSASMGIVPGASEAVSSAGLLEVTVSMKLISSIALAALSGLVAKRFRFPTPFLLGPLVTMAVLSVTGMDVPQVPRLLVMASQVSFGAYLGHTIRPRNLGNNWQKLLPLTLINSGAVIAFSFLVGYILTLIDSMDILTAFLAFAPGGMSEMAVTAMAVHANLSTVTSYQIFRMFFIMLLVPPFLKWWLVKDQPKDDLGKKNDLAH